MAKNFEQLRAKMPAEARARCEARTREHMRRLAIVEEAEAAIRIEGFTLDGEAKQIFDRFAEGELTIEEMQIAIAQLNGREFGRA